MFEIDKSVMLLIDVQGQLAQLMYEKDKLFNSLGIMIQGMKTLGVPIIWMEQIPKNLGPTTEVVAKYMTDEEPIEKFSFSCCNEPKFMDEFKKDHFNTAHLTTGLNNSLDTNIFILFGS